MSPTRAASMASFMIVGPGGFYRFVECARRQAPETVVGAEFDEHDIGLLGQQPVETPESPGRGVTAHARIDRADLHAFVSEPLLEKRRERLARLETVAGREAIAQEDDERNRRRARAACGLGLGAGAGR